MGYESLNFLGTQNGGIFHAAVLLTFLVKILSLYYIMIYLTDEIQNKLLQ